MARDFIKVDPNQAGATAARDLLAFKELLRSAYSQGLKVRGIMTHNNDGTVFTELEALFGLPAGKGQTVFDLVNGSVGAMEGTFQNSNAKDLTERVG